MSYEFYRILHLLGIFGTIMILGGIALHVMNGGTRADLRFRRWAAIIHGVGLLIILVAGFGLIAKLGLVRPIPGWLWAKFTIWLLLGGAPALIYAKPRLARTVWFTVWILAVCAATLAILKPF